MVLLPRTMILLSRFKRAESGASAVEFSFVALPFFLLIYAIVDVSLIFFASTTLENGLIAAARQIRTGEAQAANMTTAQFRELVCNQISMLLGCDGRLGIDVRQFAGFGGVVLPPALDENGNLSGNMAFQPGTAGDVVVVRAFYTWPMLTPTVGIQFANMSGGHRLLEASIAFRNEPFNGPVNN
ncbi:MAG: TadE/TadG family type IV pilus assembly protein [Micropepsaceae bacterium]